MNNEENDLSDESLELFPIDPQAASSNVMFKYEDPSFFTGILRAVTEENLEKLKELIVGGKSVNLNDNNGNTPLHMAVIKNNIPILKCLLSNDTIVINTRNFYGETPLFIAVKYELFEAAKILVHAGANVNLPNNEEVTPLHVAATYPEIAHLLIEDGANIDAIDFSGDTPLHEATTGGCLEVVCMLLYYNADANATCDHCLTPFMKSLMSEHLEIQKILLEYVVDFSARNAEDMCILALALTYDTPIVEEIIKRGANINYHLEYYTPYNAYEICLRTPNTNNFALIWDQFSNVNSKQSSIINRLCTVSLSKDQFCEYLDVITNSNNVISATACNVSLLVSKMRILNLSLDYVTKVVCVLLMYGTTLSSLDISRIFEYFDYCDLLKIALHMDIQLYENSFETSFSDLLCNPAMTVPSFIEYFVKYIKSNNITGTKLLGLRNMLQYCTFSKVYEALSSNTKSVINVLLKACPQVPCLLDLSRNVLRDHIVKVNDIKTSGQYFTLVNSLDISRVYKSILKYETRLY